MDRWSIALHGGAGAIPANMDPERRLTIENRLADIAAHAGASLTSGHSAIDVVQHTVELLEDDEHFNAGRGAVLCRDGTHELEASIMDGATGEAGAVCLLRRTRHPIALARLILDHSEHVMLSGAVAEEMGVDAGLEQVDNTWFQTKHRAEALQRFLSRVDDGGPHHATVGAVALDGKGMLAAATSTGGMTGKLNGRIGDTPIIGAGIWADARVAISCTGRGEDFIRHATARQVADRVAFGGASLANAARATLDGMPDATGGLIAVGAHGTIAMPFTSAGMYRAAVDSNGLRIVGIGHG